MANSLIYCCSRATLSVYSSSHCQAVTAELTCCPNPLLSTRSLSFSLPIDSNIGMLRAMGGTPGVLTQPQSAPRSRRLTCSTALINQPTSAAHHANSGISRSRVRRCLAAPEHRRSSLVFVPQRPHDSIEIVPGSKPAGESRLCGSAPSTDGRASLPPWQLAKVRISAAACPHMCLDLGDNPGNFTSTQA